MTQNGHWDANNEVFAIFYEGVAMHLQWPSPSSAAVSPPFEHAPALRICSIGPERLLILTVDHNLYEAKLDVAQKTLALNFQRNDVADFDYCRSTHQLFIVTLTGDVYMQQLPQNISSAFRQSDWQLLSFDPLELMEHGIQIIRVCCSQQGVLFITRNADVYVMGSCGEVFTAETQPKQMRLFVDEQNRCVDILDMVAGDDVFAALIRKRTCNDKDEHRLGYTQLKNCKRTQARAGPSNSNFYSARRQPSTATTTTQHSDIDSVTAKQELNSNSSLHSFSSSKSSHSRDPSNFETHIEQLLHQGYALLNTQVHTFGAANNGLLGTGDHVRRSTVSNLQKLDSIGVCSIAAGREHTIVRTLDGRLYHWGLNTRQQLSDKLEFVDLSAPIELKLDAIELDAHGRNVLEACCGDYRTVILNARSGGADLSSSLFLLLNFSSKDLLTLQMNNTADEHSTTMSNNDKLMQSSLSLSLSPLPPASASPSPSPPLLLASEKFTLHNYRKFQPEYYDAFANLRNQLQTLLKYRQDIDKIYRFQQKSPAKTVKSLQPICQFYYDMLYLVAVLVQSFECYYRGDYINPADLYCVKYHRECIELMDDYTKIYCDIYAINAFVEAGRAFTQLVDDKKFDLAHIFARPFRLYEIFVKFMEQLVKLHSEYREHQLAWQVARERQCNHIKLAENTQTFWQNNERNAKIRNFRRCHRRVFLHSGITPLKLSNKALSMSTTTFILFSDCLCQAGSQLQNYPLATMWLKNESDTALRIRTPEKNFTVVARTLDDRNVWREHLRKRILATLHRSQDEKVPTIRTAAYVFSRSHAKYAGVSAFGRWRDAMLDGNCYLEYPDGRLYFGEMHNGEIEGYGKMMLPSVGLYEGTFKRGKFHGHGIFEMKDNEVYEGNFRDGLFHGHGILRNSSSTYVGEFQTNSKSGYGVLDDIISGDKYMGMFADNKRTGAGTCITMNGDYFEGIFVNDELTGDGIAIFANGYYYEGELTMHGPIGKGTYYMPNGELMDVVATTESRSNSEPLVELEDENAGEEKRQSVGHVLEGHLNGTWRDVRIVAGNCIVNRQFPQYPKSIGELVVDNDRKWRTLFDNFEEELIGGVSIAPSTRRSTIANSTITSSIGSNSSETSQLWNRIAVYMTTQREREKKQEQNDSAYHSAPSYFAKNISMDFSSSTSSFDQLSLKSTNSLLATAKSSILNLNDGFMHDTRQRSHSQETLCDDDLSDLDFINACTNTSTTASAAATIYAHHASDNYNLFNAELNNWANDSSTTTASLRSSFDDSVSNLSINFNNNNNNINSISSSSLSPSGMTTTQSSALEFVPNFGITQPLGEHDVAAIRDYLVQAFRDRQHPLAVLNNRIANCFYTSYGCWKVKPTSILAKQALREWESITQRMYRFVRKLFPALPQDYCIMESSSEVVSYVTLLYPIVLSEGIYSSLFVLYANKYIRKDEIYRKNLTYAEKSTDEELVKCLGLESSFLPVVSNSSFADAIDTLKQLQEKYSPKAMLTVIENCMQQITNANNTIPIENGVILAADSMMPLTLFMVLRAAVPHLGAELALLYDLTAGENFKFEMNGFAGYCYTTLKASYEHITTRTLNKT